jgi:DNA-binding NarL/FixJ family response regulator
MKHTIVIVDDHLLIAKALTEIIDKFSKYEVLYEAGNGEQLIERFRQKKNIPDIVLLDVSMPVMDGFATAQWLKENHPGVRILTLSMQDDEKTLIRMIKCGANGYLLKNIHPAELENALDILTTKGFYYPDWATSTVLMSIAAGDKENPVAEQFNEREKELLSHVCTEMTYREIGEKMFCSPRTVESYRDTLFEKLHLKTRMGLAMYAIKHGYCKI